MLRSTCGNPLQEQIRKKHCQSPCTHTHTRTKDRILPKAEPPTDSPKHLSHHRREPRPLSDRSFGMVSMEPWSTAHLYLWVARWDGWSMFAITGSGNFQ